MVKIAILAAAGWKGAGWDALCVPDTPQICLPLHTCPEPLLPIGSNQTILSRTVGMLRARGFAWIFIVVGKPGCLYPTVRAGPGVAANTTKEQVEIGARQSPWTQARLEYVSSLGTPILSPDPDEVNYMDSYIRALEAIRYSGWDWAYIQQGDVLLSDSLLDLILGLPGGNLSFSLHPHHDIFRLDPQAAKEFRHVVEPWKLKGFRPLELILATAEVRHLRLWRDFPEFQGHWHDVDYTSSYFRLLVKSEDGTPGGWMAKYGGSA